MKKSKYSLLIFKYFHEYDYKGNEKTYEYKPEAYKAIIEYANNNALEIIHIEDVVGHRFYVIFKSPTL